MAAVNHSKTMSSLLFYHKKEKTLSHHRDRVWAGFKRFCSEFLISSLREESATNELANPKLGGKQNAFVLLPQRTQRDSNPQPPTTPTSLSTRRVLYHLRAMRPVILFRTTGWLNHVRGGRTPFTDLGDQCFRGRTNPDHQEKG